jgi:hypothetical protein
VEQVPYQVCRMVAQQQTISVPHTVEKRIPVTYTYTVPRVVCYRVPLDACGNPIVGTSSESAMPSAAAKQEPTPAKRRNAADEPPKIDSDAKTPRPVEDEDNSAVKKRPMTDLPPMKDGAPKKSAYDPQST